MEWAITANFAYHRYLVRDLIFLVGCLVISSMFPRIFLENDINLALAQSFVIIGGVALWKPVEFYQYDRRDELDVLEALVRMPVESRKGEATADNETLVLMGWVSRGRDFLGGTR